MFGVLRFIDIIERKVLSLGPDGKTTQLQLTARYLLDRGYEVVTTREPGGTKLAERIRNIVLDADAAVNPRTEVLLYLAARAEHVEKVIRPALEGGKIVLCDRFADSTMVYQGFVRGVEIDKVKALCAFAADNVQPELTILLDAAPEALLQRRADRGVQDRSGLPEKSAGWFFTAGEC